MISRSFHIALPVLVALALDGAPAAAQWAPNGIPVCTADGDQSATRGASDGTGGAVFVWVDARKPGDPDIYARRVLANGWIAPGWPADGTPVCAATGSQLAPEAISDGTGGVFILWQDSRMGAGDPDIYLQRLNSSGAVASGWPANGLAVCDTSGVQSDPAITPDGLGGAVVVWQDYRSGRGLDIYAQRVSAAGRRLWTTQGAAVCTDTLDQTGPVCAPDGSGGAFVAWEDARYSTNQISVSDIYVQHLAPSGAVASGWPVNGTPATPTVGLRFAYVPTMVRDTSGGAIVAWQDYRNINGGIYALRLTAAGTVAPGWSAGGVAVCDTSGDQVAPLAAPDGAGGAVIVWEDYRNGGTRDLFAQRMSEAGTRVPGWLPAGTAVCTAPGDQASPRLVTDGGAPGEAGSGAVVTWYDYRGGSNTDIYALRLGPAGAVAPGWTANGVALCTAAGDQQTPAAVADIGGGAIVAWSDRRSGTSYDIYAQRVTGTGQVAPSVDVPGRPAPFFRMLEPRPNPASGVAMLDFELPAASAVEARVFDLAGRVVRTLAGGEHLPAGAHRLAWDGRDDGGRPVAAGVYLVRLVAGGEAQVRRIVRLR